MKKIFRLIYRAKDYEASISFYRDKLECPVIMDWDRGVAERGSVFQLGSGEIETLALPPGMEYVIPQGIEIAVEVDGVDEHYTFAQQKGLDIRGEIADKPWGHRSYSINDPDGIKLIFFSNI